MTSTQTLPDAEATTETTETDTAVPQRTGGVKRALLGDPDKDTRAEALAAAHLKVSEKREKERERREAKAAAKRAAKENGEVVGLPARIARYLLGLVPFVLVRFVARAAVIAGVYLLVLFVAVQLVPSIGSWLYTFTGAGTGQLNQDGITTVWLVPFLFITVTMLVGTLLAIRAFWRASSRFLEAAAHLRDAGKRAKTAKVEKTTPVAREDEDKPSREHKDVPEDVSTVRPTRPKPTKSRKNRNKRSNR
jgi:hypothetical protein